jgi:phytanoyl-CoA dioxygenase PhyH
MNFVSRIQTSRALSRAKKLAANGRADEALRQLSQLVRQRDNPVLERALVDLRLQNRYGREAVMSEVGESGGDISGNVDIREGIIPEVDVADFSVPLLRRAISEAGYLIVRGFFDQQDAAELRGCVDASLNARVDIESDNEAKPADNPWYYPSPHFPGKHVSFASEVSKKTYMRTGSIRVIDSPRGSFKVLDIYRKHRMKAIVDAYFGEPAVLATRKWVFRLISSRDDAGKGIGGGWHQDGRFMGKDIRALNMWVALSDCGAGTAAPGMAIIPKRISTILETGTREAQFNWVVPPSLVEEIAQTAPLTKPHFAAGDALFFDHYSLHRSGHDEGQSENRYALESWFYASSATADNAVIDLV